MNRKSRNERILEILKRPPTQEQIEETIKRHEAYVKYMELEKHEGNCHCVRCMNEFFDWSR